MWSSYHPSLSSWAIGCFVFAMILAAICIVVSVYILKSKEPKKEKIFCVTVSMLAIIMIASIMVPTKVEQHTDIVKITHFGPENALSDIMNVDNGIYFDVNGEEHFMTVDQGKREMYEMVMNKEVELTYGKIHFLLPSILGINHLKENEWRFADIELLNSD